VHSQKKSHGTHSLAQSNQKSLLLVSVCVLFRVRYRVLSFSDVGAVRRTGDPVDAPPSSLEQLERASVIMRQLLQKCGRRRLHLVAAGASATADATDSTSNNGVDVKQSPVSESATPVSVWDQFNCEDHHTLLALAEYAHRLKRVPPDTTELSALTVTLNEQPANVDASIMT
jgi:hypothetical protein